MNDACRRIIDLSRRFIGSVHSEKGILLALKSETEQGGVVDYHITYSLLDALQLLHFNNDGDDSEPSRSEAEQAFSFMTHHVLEVLREHNRVVGMNSSRDTFIVFVALSVFFPLTVEAKERAGRSSVPECGVHTLRARRQEVRLAEYVEETLDKREDKDDFSFFREDAFLQECLSAFAGPDDDLEDPLRLPFLCGDLVGEVLSQTAWREGTVLHVREILRPVDVFSSDVEANQRFLQLCLLHIWHLQPHSPPFNALCAAVTVFSVIGRSLLAPLVPLLDQRDREEATTVSEVVRFVTEAVQVVPTSHRTLEVEGEEGDTTGVNGYWWTMHEPYSPSSVRWKGFHPQRAFVVAPALAIAATVCRSTVGATHSMSTFAVFPGTREDTLFLSPDSVLTHQYPLTTDPIDSCVLRVPPTCFKPCKLALLFSSFPEVLADNNETCPPLSLAALRDRVTQIQEGLVLFIIQSHLSDDTMRVLEGWGTAERTVVVVSSVGEWALTQLCLRYQMMPNTCYAPVDSLHAAHPGGDNVVGVLAYRVDEARVKGEQWEELRQRIVVWVGACPNTAPPPTPTTSGMYPSSESSTTSGDESAGEEDTHSGLPPYTTTVCSVLLGGSVPALQHQGLTVFRRILRTLVQATVTPVDEMLPATPVAEGSFIASLDHYLSRQAHARSNREFLSLRVASLLREGMWTYSVLFLQERDGLTAEDAWACLVAVVQGDGSTTEHQLEPLAEVESAIRVVGQLLDRLLRSVVLGCTVENEAPNWFCFPVVE
ncbi:hypothetical protein AGDE_12552 [Angomonas deanei]|uniref:Uncharacterized protein n=1 Tax=Angomonas deanei TaxID=59799 RepID=A0A7G2CDU2_9TRYP|nr:hypothetical protein AGDE_12552 [Angomonas deanei]CAD2217201.1 hypothetical protein, conserved [Angomonas deanei]|eukprot:EPY24039.1 hypothetical protein AGDE_12552 [Angomonas deanei]